MADQYKYELKKEKESKISVSVTIQEELVTKKQEQVYEKLKETVKISGFRPGKAPKKEIMAKLGTKVLNETLNEILPEVASEIVEKEELNPVTQVDYQFEDFSKEGDIVFSFSFTNYPEVKLGNLSKIKVEKQSAEVEQKEIDEVVQRLFKQQAEDNHDHDHDHEDSDSDNIEIKEITDEMVKGLKIDGVQTKKDLEKQIKERIQSIKQNDLDRDYENKLLEAAIAETKIEVPAALIDQQTETLMNDHLSQISRLGVEVEQFLEAQGTSREELEKQKRKDAEYKVKAELVLNEIARQNSILPTAQDVEAELKMISDPEIRSSYDSAHGRRHILSVLVQQRGMQKLLDIAGGSKTTEKKKPSTKKSKDDKKPKD